ncbi:MAG: aspartyl-phosphate phosphatase Spo0E family protein [Desulfitobacteriaceae bacterium]
MNSTDKMEIARAILNNAGNMNVSKEMLLKISQKMDEYIVEYYRKSGGQEDAFNNGENV